MVYYHKPHTPPSATNLSFGDGLYMFLPFISEKSLWVIYRWVYHMIHMEAPWCWSIYLHVDQIWVVDVDKSSMDHMGYSVIQPTNIRIKWG